MASSNTTMKKCATCIQNSDEQKVKPGITLCEGCHQTYCLSHFVEHRQALNKTLDDIAGQRDLLRSRIEELPTRMSKEYLKTIDDWENTMLQTVTEAAKNARQQVRQSIISEMERECSELTSKITSFRVNDDYFETDIEELQAKIEKLNEELNDLPDLHRIQLNLPTLDCSNMIHIKSFETPSLSETANSNQGCPEVARVGRKRKFASIGKESTPTPVAGRDTPDSNDSITLKPKEEYRSFIKRFLATHKPSNDLSIQTSGDICASPTMLIAIPNIYNGRQMERFVFYRESTEKFNWEHGSALNIQWSSWLQQFIVLTETKIVAVDALEKVIKEVVVEMKHKQLQYMSHWKHLCLIIDKTNRVFFYKMNKNLTDWLLLYCWSVPTTCALNESITAVGLNKHHIILSIKCNDQHRFAVHKHDMTHCSDIQLTHPCTAIQALPQGEWLLYDSSKQFYYVIDSGLEQHEEPYLSSLKDFELTISCDETDKVFLVLLSRNTTVHRSTRQVKVYTMQLYTKISPFLSSLRFQ